MIETIEVPLPFISQKIAFDRLIEAKFFTVTDECRALLERHEAYGNFIVAQEVYHKPKYTFSAIPLNGDGVNVLITEYKIDSPFVVDLVLPIYGLITSFIEKSPLCFEKGEAVHLLSTFIGEKGAISLQNHKALGQISLDVSFTLELHKPGRVLKLL